MLTAPDVSQKRSPAGGSAPPCSHRHADPTAAPPAMLSQHEVAPVFAQRARTLAFSSAEVGEAMSQLALGMARRHSSCAWKKLENPVFGA